jgi:hypothetical protein
LLSDSTLPIRSTRLRRGVEHHVQYTVAALGRLHFASLAEELKIVATVVGDSALRIRVERLARGEFKVEDLTTLFLALRDRAGGRQSVVEVGDFVAHREERKKGFVNRAVREFFVRIRFVLEFKPPNQITPYDMPAYIPELLRASAAHMDYRARKGETNFTRVSVQRALPGLLANIRNAGGRTFIWPGASQLDFALFDLLVGLHTFNPLFTEASLFDEFVGALIENGLLHKKEVADFRSIKGAVALFALSHMHQCFVDLGGGVKGYLEASPYGGGSDKIAVVAIVPAMDAKGASVAHAVFLTERTVADDCAPEMVTDPEQPYWNFPVEVGPDKKLRPLGL